MVVFRNTSHEELVRPGPLSPPSSSSPAAPLPQDDTLPESQDTELIRFYFDLFDLNHEGAIGLEELKLVLRCFCSSGGGGERSIDPNPPSEEDIESLFWAMRRDQRDLVTFPEFQLFYQTLLHSSSTPPHPPRRGTACE
jgi:hypothetical protein